LDGHQVVYEHLIRSGWFHFEIWIGLLLPAVLLSVRKLSARPSVQAVAAVLSLIAAFIGRYEFVIGGQVVPLFKGTWVPGLIDYTPSITEWMVCAFAFFLVLALYAAGCRIIGLIQASMR
jgi:molybdopterin-containing oxidoreductase family membrane subunit